MAAHQAEVDTILATLKAKGINLLAIDFDLTIIGKLTLYEYHNDYILY